MTDTSKEPHVFLCMQGIDPAKMKDSPRPALFEHRMSTLVDLYFTPEQKVDFVRKFAACGRVMEAARAAGVNPRSVYLALRPSHSNFDPEFAERVALARQDYREMIEAEVHRRAVDGWDEPVFGGKNKDQIVGYVRKYSDRLLEFHAKRHIMEYRDRMTGDIADRLQHTDMGAGIVAADKSTEIDLGTLTKEERDMVRRLLTGDGQPGQVIESE